MRSKLWNITGFGLNSEKKLTFLLGYRERDVFEFDINFFISRQVHQNSFVDVAHNCPENTKTFGTIETNLKQTFLLSVRKH